MGLADRSLGMVEKGWRLAHSVHGEFGIPDLPLYGTCLPNLAGFIDQKERQRHQCCTVGRPRNIVLPLDLPWNLLEPTPPPTRSPRRLQASVRSDEVETVTSPVRSAETVTMPVEVVSLTLHGTEVAVSVAPFGPPKRTALGTGGGV